MNIFVFIALLIIAVIIYLSATITTVEAVRNWTLMCRRERLIAMTFILAFVLATTILLAIAALTITGTGVCSA